MTTTTTTTTTVKTTTTTFTPLRPEVERAPRLSSEAEAASPLAARAFRAEGAANRAAVRARAAGLAAERAENYVLGMLPEDTLSQPSGWGIDGETPAADMAAVGDLILIAELLGVGGPGGLSGDATLRAAWAEGLGKGRAQATDGPAWDAALAAALAASTEEDGHRVCLELEDLPETDEEVSRLREVLGASHAEALAARVVLLAEGHNLLALRGRSDLPVQVSLVGEGDGEERAWLSWARRLQG